MKKFSICAAVIVILSQCSIFGDDPYLAVSEEEISVTYSGGSFHVEVSSDKDFTCGSTQPWLQVSAVAPSSVDVVCLSNGTDDARVAELVLTRGDIQKRVAFRQDAYPVLEPDHSVVYVPDTGETISIVVSSNLDYKIKCDVPWIEEVNTKAAESRVHVFNVSPNKDYSSRAGIISFTDSGTGKSESVEVVQRQLDCLELSASEVSLDCDAARFDVDVRTNVEVSIEIGAPWIKQVETRSLEDRNFSFSVEKNMDVYDRTGYVLIKGGDSDAAARIAVIQKADKVLKASEESYSLAAEAGVLEIPVTANVPFDCEVVEGGDWLFFDRKEQMTDVLSTCRLICDSNLTTQFRVGEVRLSGKDHGLTRTVLVLQLCPDARLKLIHRSSTFHAPLLYGSLFATINWGDGIEEWHSDGLFHSYESGDRHEVTITAEGIEKVVLTDLTGVDTIDLSLLY